MGTVDTNESKTLGELDVSLSTQLGNDKSQSLIPSLAGSGTGPDGSGLGVQENEARVSISDREGLKGSVVTSSDLEGGVLEDAKATGGQDVVENGGPSEIGLDSDLGNVKNQENGGDCDSEMLVEDGSDKKMEFDKDGISLVVDVHGSLGNVEKGEKKGGNEDDEVSLGENGGDQDWKVGERKGSVTRMRRKREIAREKEGLTGENNNGEDREEVNEDNREDEEDDEEDDDDDNGEDMGDKDHEYFIGDFVWGKIRSHPWWPGQIFDPSDASDYAKKYKPKNRLLVAYFGDASFSWCSSSQLKPFAENFEEMSKQSSLKSFVNAVERAVDEIGRILELKMTRSCVQKVHQLGLIRPLALNGGIKPGVHVPEEGVAKLYTTQYEPAKLFDILRYIAETVSITSSLELTLLKSWLSAFYGAKGGYELAVFHEPLNVQGLEDNNRNDVMKITDFTGPVESPVQGPSEEDWLNENSQSVLQQCTGFSEDKLYQRRKQKSVADIMQEDIDVEPENKEVGNVKKLTCSQNLGSKSGQKKRKGGDEAETQGASNLKSASGKKRGRKKGGDILGSPLSVEHKVPNTENGSGEGNEETIEGAVLKSNDDEPKEETMIVSETQGAGNLKSPSAKKRGRKKKGEVLGSPTSLEIKVINKENGSSEGNGETVRGLVSRKVKKNKRFSDKNDGDEPKEETKMVTETRGGSNLKSPTGRKRRRKKKAEILGSFKSVEINVSSFENGRSEGKEGTGKGSFSRKGKKMRGSSVENDDDDDDVDDDDEPKEETEMLSASRKRKKSKYLSPPYTSLKLSGKDSNSKRDSETESMKVAKVARMGERMTRVAGQLIGSPPISKCSGEATQKKKFSGEPNSGNDKSAAISIPQSWREDENFAYEINVSSGKVVSEIRCAALNPLYLREKKSLDPIKRFVSTFRNSIYIDGSNFKIYRRLGAVRKRKSISSNHDASKTESLQKRDEKNNLAKSDLPKLEKTGGASRKKKNKGTNGTDESSASLIVTFPPGFSLPSKDDLMKMYSKFGALNENETGVLYNSSCARVVFLNSSAAEQAFSISIKKSPFEAAKVGYRLHYPSSAASKEKKASPPLKGGRDIDQKVPSPLKKGRDIEKKVPSPKEGIKTTENPIASQSCDNEESGLLFIKQKLEMLASMVDKSGGKMSSEMKGELEAEMKGLLEKISTMGESALS